MPEAKQPFDASKHLTNLKGKDYLEVKYRLVWFRGEHPKGSIRTKLVDRATGAALMKAFVYHDDGTLLATGYGSETSSDFGDYLEKAETKAIGRALGAAGYGTQFTDDFDFGAEERGKVVDSPVVRTPATTTPQRPTSTPAATPARDVNTQTGEITNDPLCPDCGGQMWDNRAKKASGEYAANRPDFSCKKRAGNPDCKGAIWPSKEAHPREDDAARTLTTEEEVNQYFGGTSNEPPYQDSDR